MIHYTVLHITKYGEGLRNRLLNHTSVSTTQMKCNSWRKHYNLLPSITTLIMIPILYPSPRVSQLDATILDTELSGLLKQHLQSIFRLQTNRWWGYDRHPDLYDLLLNVLVFYLTVVRNGSSYGLSLQNLKLADFATGKIILAKKRWLLLGVLVGEYLFRRLQSYLYSVDEGRGNSEIGPVRSSILTKIHSTAYNFLIRHKSILLSKANDLFKILNLINFLLFLVNGRYPTIVHRLLKICLTPISGDLLRFNGDSVNYEFQNRQLVWNVMTEFLVFILPLLQLSKLKRMASRLIKLNSLKSSSINQEQSKPTSTAYTQLPLSQCAICHEQEDYLTRMSGSKTKAPTYNITNPYITNCNHIYCYVCLAGRFNAIENGNEDAESCPRCRLKLQWFKEYGNDEADIDENAIMVDLEDVEYHMEVRRKEVLKELVDPSSIEHTDVDEEENGFSEGEDIQEDLGEFDGDEFEEDEFEEDEFEDDEDELDELDEILE